MNFLLIEYMRFDIFGLLMIFLLIWFSMMIISKNFEKSLFFAVTITYIVGFIWIYFLPIWELRFQFFPGKFLEISQVMISRLGSEYAGNMHLRQIISSIILFIPLGIIISWKNIFTNIFFWILFGFCIIVFLEFLQYIWSIALPQMWKIIDIDDIILGFIWYIFGYFFGFCIKNFFIFFRKHFR